MLIKGDRSTHLIAQHKPSYPLHIDKVSGRRSGVETGRRESYPFSCLEVQGIIHVVHIDSSLLRLSAEPRY